MESSRSFTAVLDIRWLVLLKDLDQFSEQLFLKKTCFFGMTLENC